MSLANRLGLSCNDLQVVKRTCDRGHVEHLVVMRVDADEIGPCIECRSEAYAREAELCLLAEEDRRK